MPRTRLRTTLHTLWTPVAIIAVAMTAAAAPAAHAATRQVATTGADNGACTASPCRSLSYANGQAAPGDVVEVAGGSYGHQDIGRTGRGAPAVTFQPAAGASVTFDGLSIRDDNITIRDIRTGFVDVDAKGPVIANVSIINGGGDGMWVQNADRLLVQGGSWGNNQDRPTLQFGGEPGSTNVTLDGLDVHDAVATNSSVHMECIWAAGVRGFTVRNSRFRNCAYFNIYFTTLNGPDPSDVLLENNVFETTKQAGGASGADAGYAINVSNYVTKMSNFVIRNNTIQSDIAFQPKSISGSKVVNNIAALKSCTDGMQYANNVLTSVTCGPGDRKVTGAMSQFVNPSAHDWHLKSGAAAIGAADAAHAPGSDADGYARDTKPDAGAYEFGAGPAASAPAVVDPAPTIRPRTGSALLRDSALSSKRVCARRTKRCRSTRLTLRLDLAGPARILGRVERLRRHRKPRRVSRIRKSLQAGASTVRIPRNGLRRGHRYRVVFVAVAPDGTNSPAQRFTFRVR